MSFMDAHLKDSGISSRHACSLKPLDMAPVEAECKIVPNRILEKRPARHFGREEP